MLLDNKLAAGSSEQGTKANRNGNGTPVHKVMKMFFGSPSPAQKSTRNFGTVHGLRRRLDAPSMLQEGRLGLVIVSSMLDKLSYQ